MSDVLKKLLSHFFKKASKFKIFQNFLKWRTNFSLNQFDLYQQNRGNAPADIIFLTEITSP